MSVEKIVALAKQLEPAELFRAHSEVCRLAQRARMETPQWQANYKAGRAASAGKIPARRSGPAAS